MSTEPVEFALSEKGGYSGGVHEFRHAFALQRGRFVRLLEDLDPASWQARSRCTDWTVHDVARHVRDAARLHISLLAREPLPLAVPGGRFDPRSTPAVWLAESAGESPEETVRDLAKVLERERELLSAAAERGEERTVTGALHRRVHWSVSSLHTLWDAFLHERDVALPLGRTVTPAAVPELRLLTMYGLLCAASPVAHAGDWLETSLALDGAPDGAYRITHADDEVRVTAHASGAAALRGPVCGVLDSLAGRGPLPARLFGSTGEDVRKLTLLRQTVT